jgi:hypothetical protein
MLSRKKVPGKRDQEKITHGSQGLMRSERRIKSQRKYPIYCEQAR